MIISSDSTLTVGKQVIAPYMTDNKGAGHKNIRLLIIRESNREEYIKHHLEFSIQHFTEQEIRSFANRRRYFYEASMD